MGAISASWDNESRAEKRGQPGCRLPQNPCESVSRPLLMSSKAADRKYVALLAVAAGLILVLGIWARPDSRGDDAPPVSSPAELMGLQRMTQRRNVQEMAVFFSEVAANASRHLTWVAGNRSTALIWDVDGTLVTAAGTEEFPAITLVRTAEQLEAEAHRAVASPLFPIVSLRVGASDAFQPVQRVPIDVLLAGDWLVAVARREDGSYAFAPGIYGGSAPTTCGEFSFQEVTYNVNFNETMLGAGLFDLDGHLIGVIIRCEDRLAVMASADVPAALEQAASFGAQLVARYGFRVKPAALPEDAERPAQGVEVAEVWIGKAADRAGIRPGDRILSLDGTEVEAVDDLLPLVLPVAREIVELKGRRGTRAVGFTLSARGGAVPSSGARPDGAGLDFRAPRKGVAIDLVARGSSAEQAGLRSGDVVLWVNGREPVDTATLRRLLAPRSGRTRRVIAERTGRMRIYELE